MTVNLKRPVGDTFRGARLVTDSLCCQPGRPLGDTFRVTRLMTDAL